MVSGGAVRGTAFAVRVASAAGFPTGPVAAPDVSGNANHVTVLGAGPGRVVVRFPRPGRTADFALEEWCARRAAERGVGVPEVLWSGEVDGVPVQVQRYVTGANSAGVPLLEQWRVLGELARRTAGVALTADAPAGLFTRFGRDLPAAWRAHVDHNLTALAPGDPLVGLGVYRDAERSALRALLAPVREVPLDFGLAHGDLSPRNLRVDTGHEPVLVDWGSAAAGPVPLTDLLHLHVARSRDGALDAAALAAFEQGWGRAVDPRVVALVRLLSALDLVRWALERAPERLGEMTAAARRAVRRALPAGT